jgi:hypothetical protein
MGDMKLHEAYLAKAAELAGKAKITRKVADKAKLERIQGFIFGWQQMQSEAITADM